MPPQRATRRRVVLISVLAAIAAASPAYSADFVVSTTADQAAGDPVSLREALALAAANPGRDTVLLPAGPIALSDCAAGPLNVSQTDGVVVEGRGNVVTQTCANTSAFRVTGTAELRNLAVATTGTQPVAAIATAGRLWLRSVTVSGAAGPGVSCTNCLELYVLSSTVSGNAGGGVRANVPAVRSTITVRDSRITGNSATGPGGGIAVTGGGTRPSHTFVDRTTITGNSSVGDGAGGGGISSTGSDLYVSRSVISSNYAGNDEFPAAGGGIWFRAPERLPESGVTVTGSTVSGNVASLSGGGLALAGGGTINILSTGISRNTSGAQGGGIAVQANRPAGDLRINGVTVAGNTAGPASGGGGLSLVGDVPDASITRAIFAGNSAGRGGGIDIADRVGVSLTWSTLMRNTSARGANAAVSGEATLATSANIVAGGVGGPDCSVGVPGALASGGYSLLGDASCGPTAADRVSAADPGVSWTAPPGDTLAVPGALAPSSPAVGLVPGALCAGNTDALGRPRSGAGCAAGALEPVSPG